MEHCRSPDGVTRVSVRLYYTMLSRVYLSVSWAFLLPRDALQCKARSCYHLSSSVRPSVRLSVCPSVTLVDHDHIGGKSWKLIAQTISPLSS